MNDATSQKSSSETPSSIEPGARKQAIVIGTSRRHAIISPDGHELLKGTSSSKALDITVGDQVMYSKGKSGEIFIDTILPRKNCIARSYRGETRNIAVNLDHLFIVAAVLPLFNTFFIDRIATVAHTQGIAVTLLVNKVDLGLDSTRKLIETYTNCGFRVLLTSATMGDGIDNLREFLASPDLSVVALAGISGVGKSTFVNRLVPGADQKIGEANERIKTGRQTTSQAFGFLYERTNTSGVLIVDLPGIQNFGISHLTQEQVAEAFPEILESRGACEFSDCAHVLEGNCAVKKAVEQGFFADCRYQSYLHMLDEIKEAKEY